MTLIWDMFNGTFTLKSIALLLQIKNLSTSEHMWWYIPVIPALGR